jgi:hypothetical protein
MGKLARLVFGIGILVPASFAATLTFNLSPLNGFVEGAAGTSVGWGYTITNTDLDYVAIQSMSFEDGTPIGIFRDPPPGGVPASLIHGGTDGGPLIVAFIPDFSGLQYDISAGAALAWSTQGRISLSFDTFSDPDMTDQIGFGDTVFATYDDSEVIAEVYVNQESASAVPEPATLALLGGGLACLYLRGRRPVS